MSFRDVMAAALYDPEYGYYTNLRGFGAEGDFITSPEHHPAFGWMLGRQALDARGGRGRPAPLRTLTIRGGCGAPAVAFPHPGDRRRFWRPRVVAAGVRAPVRARRCVHARREEPVAP